MPKKGSKKLTRENKMARANLRRKKMEMRRKPMGQYAYNFGSAVGRTIRPTLEAGLTTVGKVVTGSVYPTKYNVAYALKDKDPKYLLGIGKPAIDFYQEFQKLPSHLGKPHTWVQESNNKKNVQKVIKKKSSTNKSSNQTSNKTSNKTVSKNNNPNLKKKGKQKGRKTKRRRKRK
jgi:hypothetical protein